MAPRIEHKYLNKHVRGQPNKMKYEWNFYDNKYFNIFSMVITKGQ